MNRIVKQGTKAAYIENAQNVSLNYGEKEIKKLLGAIPIYPEIFIGRDDDLEKIHEKLFNEQNCLLLVNGEGGIGKTTVASTYYHKYIEEYSHLVWIVAERSIEDALLTLVLELQLKLDDNITGEQRINEILRELMMLGKPSLLVIDNANDLEDLDKSYSLLRQCFNLHLLLTTRITEFARAETYPIMHLNETDARELFVRHYQNHDPSEDELLNRILKAVGYNTLVIELQAKNLNNFNNILHKEYTLDTLLKDLQQKGVLGLSKSKTITTDWRLQTAKPEAIVEAMYDISALKEEEKALLSVFAVLPAVNIPFKHLETLLPGFDDLDKLALSIAQKGWLEFDSEQKSFKCNPVVQEITRKQNHEKLFEHCQVLVNTLTNQLDYEPTTGSLTEISYELAVVYIQYAVTVCQYLYDLRVDITILLERIGNFYENYGNLDKALKYFEERSSLGKELYEANPQNVGFKNGLAISYSKLGLFYRDEKEEQNKAFEYFQKAKRLWDALVQDFPSYIEFLQYRDKINKELDNFKEK